MWSCVSGPEHEDCVLPRDDNVLMSYCAWVRQVCTYVLCTSTVPPCVEHEVPVRSQMGWTAAVVVCTGGVQNACPLDGKRSSASSYESYGVLGAAMSCVCVKQGDRCKKVAVQIRSTEYCTMAIRVIRAGERDAHLE